MSKAVQMRLLMGWHAILGGGFLVAYLTGDDFAAMHLFSGYLVMIVAALRLLIGLIMPSGTMLALKPPRLRESLDWGRRLMMLDSAALRGRPPIHDLMAAIVLGTVGLAALSGWLADTVRWTDDLHDGLTNASLIAVLAHVALVWALAGLRRTLSPPTPAGALQPTTRAQA